MALVFFTKFSKYSSLKRLVFKKPNKPSRLVFRENLFRWFCKTPLGKNCPAYGCTLQLVNCMKTFLATAHGLTQTASGQTNHRIESNCLDGFCQHDHLTRCEIYHLTAYVHFHHTFIFAHECQKKGHVRLSELPKSLSKLIYGYCSSPELQKLPF
jgi:hypothetical protein